MLENNRNTKNLYICTKPYQYINCLNLLINTYKEPSDILIYGIFNDSFKFYKRLQTNNGYWDKIYYCTNYKELPKLKVDFNVYNKIFLDYWRHRINLLTLLKSSTWLYEEGIGNYSHQKSLNLIKKYIRICLDILGIRSSKYIGLSIFHKGVYLYYPQLLENKVNKKMYLKKLYQFNKKYIDHLRDIKTHIYKLFNFNPLKLNLPENKSVKILIGDWDTDLNTAKKILKGNPGNATINYFKPHPHIKNIKPIYHHTNVNLLINAIPVEYFLLELIERNNVITVYHFNSTAVLHFYNKIKNLKIINLGKFHSEYDELLKYIKSKKYKISL